MKTVVQQRGPSARVAGALAVLALAILPAGGQGQVAFEEHVLSLTAIAVESVYATDLDGDGDTDVVAGSSDFVNKIVWYENHGGSRPSFTRRIVPTTVDFVMSVFAADVDGDGDSDVLSASFDGQIAWYENDGGSPPAFSQHLIPGFAITARSVFAADVDGDGDMDALSASDAGWEISWYENDGGSPPAFTAHLISMNASSAESVFATDVDGDGDIDVLSGHREVAWYESDGASPPSFAQRIISKTNASSVYARDVDGDGDADVVAATGEADTIVWYENDGGSPSAFTERFISDAELAHAVFAADVDGDGDTDVLSASIVDDKLAWYENDGGSPPVFTEWIVSSAVDPPTTVFAVDVDGDGDTDVISNSHNDRKLAWWENLTGALPCSDVAQFKARCDLSGSLGVRATMTDTTHNGETVTIGVDGTPHIRTIVGETASYSEPGAGLGPHTITLDSPPMCFEPIDVECPAGTQIERPEPF